MEKKKVKHFQSVLQEIRIEIVGGVEKSQNNGKNDEAEHMPDISDDAARAYDRKLQGDLEEQEWNKLKQVESVKALLGQGTFMQQTKPVLQKLCKKQQKTNYISIGITINKK